jgi:peroxiredoxin
LNSANVFAQNGKPTVLMFWLTTCVPCRHELTAISGKYESWQAETGFNLYAISIDFPKNYGNFVKRVEDSRWPFPAYHDLNREFSVILPGQLNGLPQTFILDKTGRIVHHKRKFSPGDEDVLYDLIKEVAKQ